MDTRDVLKVLKLHSPTARAILRTFKTSLVPINHEMHSRSYDFLYKCYLHWPGEAGPTKEFDVPLKVTLKPKEVLKATEPKRKAPLARHAVPFKRRKSGSNRDKSHPVVDEAHVNDYVSDSAEVIENSRLENDQEKSAKSRDFATQTDVSKHELSYKLEAMMMMRNAAKSRKSTNIVSKISYKLIKENSEP